MNKKFFIGLLLLFLFLGVATAQDKKMALNVYANPYKISFIKYNNTTKAFVSSYGVGGGLDFKYNTNGGFTASIGAGLGLFKFKTTTEEVFTYNSINVLLMAEYNFRLGEKFAIVPGIGGGIDYSIFKNDKESFSYIFPAVGLKISAAYSLSDSAALTFGISGKASFEKDLQGSDSSIKIIGEPSLGFQYNF